MLIFQFGIALWQRLTTPPPAVQAAYQRVKSQLLASLLLAMILILAVYFPLCGLVAPSSATVVPARLISITVLVIIYGLTRTGFQKGASVALALYGSLLIFTLAITNSISFLYYLVAVVAFSGIFLSKRAMLIIFVLQSVAMLLLPAFTAITGDAITAGPLPVLTLLTILVLLMYRAMEQFAAFQRAQINEQENRYRNLVEKVHDIIYSHAPTGEILSVNVAGESTTGWKREELIGQHFLTVVHPDDAPLALQMSVIATRGEIPPSFKLRIRAKAGDYRLMEFSVAPRFKNGHLFEISGIVRDVTERQQAEEALRLSEERYRLVSELVSDYAFYVHFNPDGTIKTEWITDSFVRVTGYQWDELEAIGWQTYIHPHDRNAFNQQLDQVRAGCATTEEYRIVTKGGETRWIYARRHPIWAGQQVVGYYGVAQDITERKQAERALREVENRLHLVVANLPIILFALDRDGVITLAEGHGLVAVQHAETAVGQRVWDMLPDLPDILADVRRALAGAEFTSQREVYQHVIEIQFHPIMDESGQPNGVSGIIFDVTEREQANQHRLKLALEHERLAVINQFILAVSHDFRTSLATIETSRYLIGQRLPPPERERVEPKLGQIQRSIYHLTEQIENLRSVFALVNPALEPCDLNRLVEALIGEHSSETQRKQLIVTFTPDRQLPITKVDAEGIRRALHHLLLNALNYTPAGGLINLRTYQTDHHIAIEMRDTGIGIEPEHLDHIFELFYRGDAARSIYSGGIGLGLSIARMIAEAHGGSIAVASTPSQGSTFTVTLPLTPAPFPTLDRLHQR